MITCVCCVDNDNYMCDVWMIIITCMCCVDSDNCMSVPCG